MFALHTRLRLKSDDVSVGTESEESAYELYLKSKVRLAEGGFTLRKFITNSGSLRRRIDQNEKSFESITTQNPKVEDMTYAKSSLTASITRDQPETHRILGVQWNYMSDKFVFDISKVHCHMVSMEPTKRNVVSMSARFFDPLGIMSPVTVLLKIFFQTLCESKIDWDEPLPSDLQLGWDQLVKALEGSSTTLTIPRCYYTSAEEPSSIQLYGFCDASTRAYAAVVYLRIEYEFEVTLYWIRGFNREWKQFVENRVTNIRSLTKPNNWFHCPGSENPADILSRGMTVSELSRTNLWLSGPQWLYQRAFSATSQFDENVVPEECCAEVKHTTKKSVHNLLVSASSG